MTLYIPPHQHYQHMCVAARREGIEHIESLLPPLNWRLRTEFAKPDCSTRTALPGLLALLKSLEIDFRDLGACVRFQRTFAVRMLVVSNMHHARR